MVKYQIPMERLENLVTHQDEKTDGKPSDSYEKRWENLW